MQIDVSTNPQSFKLDTLSYKKADWKMTTADVCYYQVQNPTYYYQSGKVFLTFTQMEEGVEVYLNAGENVRNSSIAMEDYNRTVQLNKKYEIDQSLNYIITAIPKYNNYNTTFSFEYNTDGTEYPFFEWAYYQWFQKHPNGNLMLYIGAGLAGFLLLILICCVCFCVRKCLRKKSQIDPFKNTELTTSNYAKNKASLGNQ